MTGAERVVWLESPADAVQTFASLAVARDTDLARIHALPIDLEDGRTAAMSVAFPDVTVDTDRLRQIARDFAVRLREILVRKAYEEDRRLLESVIHSTRDGVVVTQANDRTSADRPILYANPAFLEMTGYSADEVIGRNVMALNGPRTRKKDIRAILAAIRSRRSAALEVLSHRKDGTTFWNALSLSQVFWRSGEITHWIWLQRDVTQTRRLLDETRAREADFRHLFERNPIPMMVCGRKTFRILKVNEAAVAHYGYAPGQWRTMRIVDLGPPADAEAFKADIQS